MTCDYDWEKVIKKFFPWCPDFTSIIPVAAVAKTKGNNPAHEFPSEGLNVLCKCIWETNNSMTKKVIRFFRMIYSPIIHR